LDRPTPEEFAQAPLFRPYIMAEAVYTDYSAEQVVLEGFTLVREDSEGNGFSYKLEGIPMLSVTLDEEDGKMVWSGKFFDGTGVKIYSCDMTTAATEFAGMIHDMIRQRTDGLVFHFEAHGIEFGPELDHADYDYGWHGDDGEYLDEQDLPVGVEERFGDPVRIVRKGFRSWVEGEEAARPWGEVREKYARAGEDGEPLCPASLPILAQLDAIERKGENVSRHRADLKSLRQIVGNPAEIHDLSLRAGIHMFDMVDSDLQDPVVPQAAIEEYRQAKFAVSNDVGEYSEDHPANSVVTVDPTAMPAPRDAERPLEELMKEATGFSVGSFTELRSMPAYMREQIRATVRPLFEDIFGRDFPMERVVVGRPATGDPESYAAFMHYFLDGELVKDVGPIKFAHMPGYETSNAEVRRRDGWDALVFSDFNGTYAYAVPSPSLDHDLKEGADEPEGTAFRM